jgi:hypothetical protein
MIPVLTNLLPSFFSGNNCKNITKETSTYTYRIVSNTTGDEAREHYVTNIINNPLTFIFLIMFL